MSDSHLPASSFPPNPNAIPPAKASIAIRPIPFRTVSSAKIVSEEELFEKVEGEMFLMISKSV